MLLWDLHKLQWQSSGASRLLVKHSCEYKNAILPIMYVIPLNRSEYPSSISSHARLMALYSSSLIRIYWKVAVHAILVYPRYNIVCWPDFKCVTMKWSVYNLRFLIFTLNVKGMRKPLLHTLQALASVSNLILTELMIHYKLLKKSITTAKQSNILECSIVSTMCSL